MRMPEPGPFGETRFEASDRAIAAALLVNRPLGGWVESVVTLATQRRDALALGVVDRDMFASPLSSMRWRKPDLRNRCFTVLRPLQPRKFGRQLCQSAFDQTGWDECRR